MGDLFAALDPLPVPQGGATPLPGKVSLGGFVERSYLEYAMSVVMGRALPDVADGQKPVQRRILFAMHELGLYRPARHVKSARVVGDVIGKYHPHGDTAAYEALVRQAQDFTLRYPLIDGQGNFGSRDGDGAAAMRYTECRLTPMAELLLGEIRQDTVDFIPNYDGSFSEPRLLPARLPLLLLNGASGIGVGMATEIPSHNLTEVGTAVLALLDDPALSLEDLLRMIPGPDLPGGGQIISRPGDIAEAYRTGRGSLRMRACWTVESLARGQWRVVVTELPHGVSARDVLEDVEKLTNPRVREGKKSLSPEQGQLKALWLNTLDLIRDESDKNASVRLVFEPKSSRQDPQAFVNLLLAHTRLETNLSLNLVMLGRDGRPRPKDLKSILSEWIEFRYTTVIRRTRFELERVERRLHILQGRQRILLDIDEVIRLIREADDPKVDLMERYDLSEIQADDILEIRLRQLARLEGIRIDQEIAGLSQEEKGLQRILSGRDAQTRLLKKEIAADIKTFGDARRTRMEAQSFATLETPVLDEPLTVTLSTQGWVRSRQGHHLDAAQFTYKSGDAPRFVIETRSIHPLLLLDTQGRVYTLRAADIPGGRGDGIPLTSLIDLPAGSKVVQMFGSLPEDKWLVTGSGGNGFVVKGEDLLSKVRGGKAFLTLEEGETPLCPVRFAEGLTHVAALSMGGRLLVFPVDELKILPRGRGVILMALGKGDTLRAVTLIDPSRGLVLRGETRSGKGVDITLNATQLVRYTLMRARKGSQIESKATPVDF
ncbi:MAG: DNA topoisomerase IV subunit A [Ferrovum sp.]|nr:DNA topoisomerase IV subunit A [Ferrovum sp.]NDU87045.1 DNA topoisomerase IV subunit A [Ferrovum sp.]